MVEQDVLVKDKDGIDKLFLDHGGLNMDKVNKDIVDGTSDGVETYMVDDKL